MYQERFYSGAYAILSNIDFILLRVEFLLLYKKLIPSIIFVSVVQIVTRIPVLLQLNATFVAATFLSVGLLLDLGKSWLLPKIEYLLLMSTGFDMASEVDIALKNKEIFSVEELSFHAAKGFRIFLKLINIFAPYREQRPLLFLILSCIMSLLLIWIGLTAKEHNLTYVVVNIFLLLPAFMHYRIFSRTWSVLKPYIDQIEAEFDRGQIESIAEREAGERELWEPLATSSFFNPSERRYNTSTGRFDNFEVDVDDLDASESQFIQSFIPHRLHISKEKNKVALDAMTREIMETCRNQEDIDEWFLEVTQDPKHPDKRSQSGGIPEKQTRTADLNSLNANSGATGDSTLNSEFDSAEWEEFSPVRRRRSCCSIASRVTSWAMGFRASATAAADAEGVVLRRRHTAPLDRSARQCSPFTISGRFTDEDVEAEGFGDDIRENAKS
ncbi:expressed conserved protein [Echinococcus multilocularis]|uniref:Expressed conserved protein n=1 Tax=Echinococcus multilocularis TaxID=6211 RepID=A0A068YFG0_ECHMU|nr:expressed conserved protein [Echinococcus multilocularis]